MKKTKIHLLLIAALILGSYACNEPAKNPENPGAMESNADSSGGGATPDVPLCHLCDSTGLGANSCGGDRKVKLSCVGAWQYAWDSARIADNSPLDGSRVFQLKNLNILQSACPSCDAVRIYFGWRVSDSLNANQVALMMMNVDSDSCSDNYKNPSRQNGPVLMSAIDRLGKPYEVFIDTSIAKTHAINWKNQYYPAHSNYLTVYSYTFNKQALDGVCKLAAEEIVVNLAIHKADSICMPNFDYAGKGKGNVIDLVIRPDQTTSGSSQFEYIDFARPCPNYCPGARLIK